MLFRSREYGAAGSTGEDAGSAFGRMYAADGLGEGIGVTRPAKDPRVRPKAIVAPRRTEKENRPFFTRDAGGLGSLSKGAPAGSRPDYAVSDRVRHIKYGEGTVLKIEEGARDYQVTVDFDKAGTKVMYAAFAKLRKIE